jgi:hypothetical protein
VLPYTIEVIEARREWANELMHRQQVSHTLVQVTYDEEDEVAGIEGYCCLGVMCDIADPDNTTYWRGEDMPIDPAQYESFGLTDEPDVNDLFEVNRWHQLDSTHFYARLNDKAGFTFPMIARVVLERVL